MAYSQLEMVGCVEGFEDSQTLFLKLFQFRETAEEHLKELHREVARRTAAEDLRRQQVRGKIAASDC